MVGGNMLQCVRNCLSYYYYCCCCCCCYYYYYYYYRDRHASDGEKRREQILFVRSGKSEAELRFRSTYCTIKYNDRHEASRGLSATAELLALPHPFEKHGIFCCDQRQKKRLLENRWRECCSRFIARTDKRRPIQNDEGWSSSRGRTGTWGGGLIYRNSGGNTPSGCQRGARVVSIYINASAGSHYCGTLPTDPTTTHYLMTSRALTSTSDVTGRF